MVKWNSGYLGKIMSKKYTVKLNLKPDTFGNSKACFVLVDMMNQGMIDIVAQHKILSLINNLCIKAKAVATINHTNIRATTLDLVKQQHLKLIDLMPYEMKFKSHLKNVVHYIFNRAWEESKLDNRTK